MKENNDILVELREISPLLASLEKTNVFAVPENYFDHLTERITVYNFLNQEKKPAGQNLQQVPEGYFNTLSDQILLKIKNEEADNSEEDIVKLYPVLSSLKNKNVFQVPAGYFEDLAENIVKKVSRPTAKIVTMSAEKKWWRYAAAAVITAAIAISSLQIFNNSDKTESSATTVASNQLPDYITTSFQYKTPQQLDEGIASLSPDEIANYLEKTGNIMDNDILINDVNPNELPAETDYLTDENTLNNFLNSLGTSAANK